MGQISLERSFLISIWLEAIFYGYFLCVFLISLYVNMTTRRFQDRHWLVMFTISVVMFFLATLHIAVNCDRLIQAYVVHRDTVTGPTDFLNNLGSWSHVAKDTVYATQQILGNGAAIYRCWIILGHDYKLVALPTILLLGSIFSGYAACATYLKIDPNESIFTSALYHYITTFFALAVVQNVITTGLMAFRIWNRDRASSLFRATEGSLRPVLYIIIESAFIQLLVQMIHLGLYAGRANAQFILLESVCPIVGIAFNGISLRIRLRHRAALPRTTNLNTVIFSGGNPRPEDDSQIQLTRIAIRVTRTVVQHSDLEEAGPKMVLPPPPILRIPV